MLLLITLLAGAILFFCGAILFDEDRQIILKILSIIFAVIFFIVFIIEALNTFSLNIDVEADTAACREKYNSLYSQAINGLYNNDNDYGKKELADQITKWNVELEKYKMRKNNIWISIKYPIDIDQFETIPLDLLAEGDKKYNKDNISDIDVNEQLGGEK